MESITAQRSKQIHQEADTASALKHPRLMINRDMESIKRYLLFYVF